MTLDRANGETHVDALRRLKQTGDPFAKGWIRQLGDTIQVDDAANPNIETAVRQAMQTPEFAKSNALMIVHKAGNAFEVESWQFPDFLRNPKRYITASLKKPRQP